MAINPEPRIVLNDGQTNSQQEITSWLGNLSQVAEQSSPRQLSTRAALQLELEQKEARAAKAGNPEFFPLPAMIPHIDGRSSNAGPVLQSSQANKSEEFIETGDQFTMPLPVPTPVLRPNPAHKSSIKNVVREPQDQPVSIDIEFKYAGSLSVQYHAAITVGQILVLVYDHSGVRLNRWVPPAPVEGEYSDPFAMLIREPGKSPAVYLAHYTGLNFRDGDREYFVLTVEQAKPVDE